MTKSVISAGVKTLTAVMPETLKPEGDMFKWVKHNVGPTSTLKGTSVKAFITRIVRLGERYDDIENQAIRAFTNSGYKVTAETLQVSTGAIYLRVYFHA